MSFSLSVDRLADPSPALELTDRSPAAVCLLRPDLLELPCALELLEDVFSSLAMSWIWRMWPVCWSQSLNHICTTICDHNQRFGSGNAGPWVKGGFG